MATAWPRIVEALVTLLPTLPGWAGVTVYDGPVNSTANALEYVTVGHQDGADTGGAFTQDYADDGIFWQESGDVVMRLACNTGSDDLTAVRDRGFALLDALVAHLQTDRWLGGVLSADGYCNVTVDPEPIRNSSGTAMSLLITLHYYTRI